MVKPIGPRIRLACTATLETIGEPETVTPGRPKPESVTPGGPEPVFLESIHHQLDGLPPVRSARAARQQLAPFIDNLLQDPENRVGPKLKNVRRLSENRFLITTPGAPPAIRTRAQTELHVTIQSHLRQIGAIDDATGDSIGFDPTNNGGRGANKT